VRGAGRGLQDRKLSLEDAEAQFASGWVAVTWPFCDTWRSTPCKNDPTKGSLRGKLKRACWVDAYLASLLALF
jgi:hypothetical protein